MRNKYKNLIDAILSFMPKDILSFSVDQDILFGTVCGFSIDYISDLYNLDKGYVIESNNRWFGFDGWKEGLTYSPYHSFGKIELTETEKHICEVYKSMLKKVEEYYEGD